MMWTSLIYKETRETLAIVVAALVGPGGYSIFQSRRTA